MTAERKVSGTDSDVSSATDTRDCPLDDGEEGRDPVDRKPSAASSAGVCSTCGKHVEKRYGGEGKYLPECADCWTSGSAEEMAVARAIEEARYAD